MPIRVKCRCGQELVVRLNEWVYALVGLLVLSLLVNGTALVYIAVRIDRPNAPVVIPVGAPSSVPASPPQGSSASENAPATETPGSASVTAFPPAPAAPLAPPRDPVLAPAHASALGDGESAPAVEARPSPDSLTQAGAVHPPQLPPGPLPGVEPPILRLLVAAKTDDPGLLAAFAQDSDPVVRRWCERRLSSDPSLATREIGHAAGSATFEGKARALLESSAAVTAIKTAWARDSTARGVDVVLAIDGTESMAPAIEALKREHWLAGALRWAVPELRIGLLVYRDEVGRCVGLDAPLSDFSNALESLRGEGGGDVPEGVHEALKAALQLGRFRWRPLAQKHVAFVGDAPPSRSEIPALLSLARECHAEAGYSIHAVSVLPCEGRKATPQFPELAGAGGGRSVTAAEDRIAEELFLCLFPAEARAELLQLLPFFAEAGF